MMPYVSIVFALIFLEDRAFGYLEPASGSLWYQMIVSIVLVIFASVGTFRHYLRARLRRFFGDSSQK